MKASRFDSRGNIVEQGEFDINVVAGIVMLSWAGAKKAQQWTFDWSEWEELSAQAELKKGRSTK